MILFQKRVYMREVDFHVFRVDSLISDVEVDKLNSATVIVQLSANL